jgi:glyoxylase-like metal-dependent hydrolase (beta-lactamase superfamily II)
MELVKLADGVYAAIRREPLGLAQNGNSLIVIGNRDALVVDAQFTREATLETLAAVRSVTKLPVRWVVNTHWHDDHFAGNQVYRDTFPQVEFIIQANTREDLTTTARANRSGELQGGPGAMNRFERLVGMGLGVDSTPASPAEAAVMKNALRIYRQYLAESPQFRETMDGPTVQSRHTVDLGKRTVELRWFGAAATRGDLVAWVPDARVAAAGDLLVHPVPFAFSANPEGWAAALDSLEHLQPSAIVPGHGSVLRDLAFLRATRGALAAISSQVAAAAKRGDSLAVIRRTATVDSIRNAYIPDEKWMRWMWQTYFLGPVINQSYRAARR